MNKIDIENDRVLKDSYSVQGVYHIDNRIGCKNVAGVVINSCEVKHVFACDVNRGVAIATKFDDNGKVVINDDSIVYELKYGKVEVILNGT